MFPVDRTFAFRRPYIIGCERFLQRSWIVPDGFIVPGEEQRRMVERRRHKRILLDVYIVLDMLTYGQAKNLCANGMCVQIPDQVEKGSIVHVKFTLPGAPGVSLIGNISWAQKAEEGKCVCGMEFLDFSNNDREIVRTYVERRLGEGQESE